MKNQDMIPWADKEFARIDETAAAFGVSVFPIREAIRNGALPAYKIGRSTVLNVAEAKSWFRGRLTRIESGARP